jgi:hypothetical protein
MPDATYTLVDNAFLHITYESLITNLSCQIPISRQYNPRFSGGLGNYSLGFFSSDPSGFTRCGSFFCSASTRRSIFFISSPAGSCSGTMPRLPSSFRTSSLFLTCSRAMVGSIVGSELKGTTLIYHEITKERKREKELIVLNFVFSLFRPFVLKMILFQLFLLICCMQQMVHSCKTTLKVVLPFSFPRLRVLASLRENISMNISISSQCELPIPPGEDFFRKK